MRRWTSAAAIVVLLGVAVAEDDKPKDGKGAKGDAPAAKPADDDDLPKLDGAKGKPFFIDHSPDDKTCPFRMAEEARDALKKAGASVEFVTYEGGHGWNGDVFDRLKKGIEHLTKNAPK